MAPCPTHPVLLLSITFSHYCSELGMLLSVLGLLWQQTVKYSLAKAVCAIVQQGYTQKHFHCLPPNCGTLEVGRQLWFECSTLENSQRERKLPDSIRVLDWESDICCVFMYWHQWTITIPMKELCDDPNVWFLERWCLLSSFREGYDQTGVEKERPS